MNFHSATASRIREMAGTVSVDYRATLHYSDTNCAVGIDDTVVVVKNVEGMKNEN